MMQELIELGANNIIVPGLLADGCLPITLTTFMSSNPKDYNLKTGCLDWLNNFAQFHNQYLRAELKRIRHRHPHAVVFYADYFNAALRLYSSPEQYGFGRNALKACCGGGGPYNFNSDAQCGDPSSTVCAEPSIYISWDGAHSTEATNRLIAKGLLEGPFTIPPISDQSCISIAVHGQKTPAAALVEHEYELS
ncbi:hypothetical protein M9H77_26085 [Catharanthus roseus]|uniref:Uncharacterized protein n=1 Tax=Catharanthus roseus TaxID=4058 RepID=A0ACC0AA18_CATRO|nr:hypothetical protein M9H77_26085 [Catharanthus roseus]